MNSGLSQIIECKKVIVTKQPKEERSFSKAEAKKLAESIDATGLLHPIGVRVADKDGFHEIIYGRQRFNAVFSILGKESIEAKVYSDFDEDDEQLARITENLHRAPLSKAQHLHTIAAYAAILMKRKPELAGGGTTRVEKMNKARKAKAAGDSPEPQADQDTTSDPEAAAAPEKTVAELTAEATGVSPRAARRAIKIAGVFNEEQITALEAFGAVQDDLELLAGIKDEPARKEAVNLVLSGMDAKEAKDKVVAPPAGEGHANKVENMSDPEWLEHFCSTVRSKLSDTGPFDRSATIYRRTRAARQEFAKASKKILDIAEASGSIGQYGKTLRRALFPKHPKDWTLCPKCEGQGGGQAGKCKGCFDDGFTVPVEASK